MGSAFCCYQFIGRAERPFSAYALKRLRHVQRSNASPRSDLERVVKQRGRTAVGAGNIRDVMGIKNQPAIAFFGGVKRAFDAGAIDATVDQGQRAQKLHVDTAAVYARHDTTAGLERSSE